MIIDSRVARFQRKLQELEVSAAILVAISDFYYFSGTAQTSTLIIPAQGDAVLLVTRDYDRARTESPLRDVRRSTSFTDVREVVSSLGASNKVIGLAQDILPTATYLRIVELLPQARFVDITRPMRQLRMLKDAEEVARIRHSAKLADLGHEAAMRILKPGLSELEVSAEIELELVRAGADGYCYPRNLAHTIRVVNAPSGPNMYAPHALPTTMPGPGVTPLVPFGPTRRTLVQGDSFTVDIAGSYQGYIADEARTYSLGRASNAQREIVEAVRFIIEETLPLLRPGTVASDVFKAAQAAAAKTPYAAHFLGGKTRRVRFVGHGVGLELDELPMLAPGDTTVLSPNMAIAYEPIIMAPGIGAATLENTVLITESGHEVLTKRPMELIEL